MIKHLSIKYVRIILQLMLDRIVVGKKEEAKLNENIKTIVFVRMDNIGDFIIWLPYVEALINDYYSGYRIILICEGQNGVLAYNTGLFHKVFTINKRLFTGNLIYRSRTLKRISRIHSDQTIQMTYSRSALIGDSIVNAISSRTKIGSSGDINSPEFKILEKTNRTYDYLVPETPTILLEETRNASFCRNIGYLGGFKKGTIFKNLKSPDILEKYSYIVICPQTSDKRRDWQLENYEWVIDRLISTTQAQIVVCGSQRFQLNNRNKHMEHKIINMSGKTSILEYVAIIRDAKCVVTGDTSAAHIANYFDKKRIIIAGCGQPGRFFSYERRRGPSSSSIVFENMSCAGCNWECYDKSENTFPCIDLLKRERVLNAIKNQLNK